MSAVHASFVDGESYVFLPTVKDIKDLPVDLSSCRTKAQRPLSERVQTVSNYRFSLDAALEFSLISPEDNEQCLKKLRIKASLLSLLGFGSLAGALIAAGRAYIYRASLLQTSRYVHIAATIAGLVISYLALNKSSFLRKKKEQNEFDASFTLEQFAKMRTQALEKSDRENPFSSLPPEPCSVTDDEAKALFAEKLDLWAAKLIEFWPWVKDPYFSGSNKTTQVELAAKFLTECPTPLSQHIYRWYHFLSEIKSKEKDLRDFDENIEHYKQNRDMLVFVNKATEILRRVFPGTFLRSR
jgi:hypothetical protein